MKEILTRSLSGLLYITVLVASLQNEHALIIVFFLFGIICLTELKKLILLKSLLPYFIFALMYFSFGYWQHIMSSTKGQKEAILTLQVLTISVQFILIKSLFSKKKTSIFKTKPYLITTFYLSSSFVFLMLIANYMNTFSPMLILGSFMLIWINDTFAYLIGKNFGKQKLFPRISPKKTIEGFLGGLVFSCISSYFIANYTGILSIKEWGILSLIISVTGTLGDLIESKFKRQANVKDSGAIMPGHGGLFDRFDSIIFAAPFIYLFLIFSQYVS